MSGTAKTIIRDQSEKLGNEYRQPNLVNIFRKIRAGENLSEEETDLLEHSPEEAKTSALESIDTEDEGYTEKTVTPSEVVKSTPAEPFTEDELKGAQGLLNFLKSRGIKFTSDKSEGTDATIAAMHLTAREEAAMQYLTDIENDEKLKKEEEVKKQEQAYKDASGQTWEEYKNKAEQEAKDKAQRDIEAKNIAANEANYKLGEQSYDAEHSAQTAGMANTDTGWTDEQIAKHVISTKNTFNDLLCRKDENGEYNAEDKAFADKVFKKLANAKTNGLSVSEALKNMPEIHKTLQTMYDPTRKVVDGKLQASEADKKLIQLRKLYEKDAKFNEFCTGAKLNKKRLDKLDSKEATDMATRARVMKNLANTNTVDTDTGALTSTEEGNIENKSVNRHRGNMSDLQTLYSNGKVSGAKLRDFFQNADKMDPKTLAAVTKIASRSDSDHTEEAWLKELTKPGARVKITTNGPMSSGGRVGVILYNEDHPEGISDHLDKAEDVNNFFAAGAKSGIAPEIIYEGAHAPQVEAAISQAWSDGDANIFRNQFAKTTGKYQTMDENGFIEEHDINPKEPKSHLRKEFDTYYQTLADAIKDATPEQIEEYLGDTGLTPSKYLGQLHVTKDELNPMYEADKRVREDTSEASADNMRTAAKRINSLLNAAFGGKVKFDKTLADAGILNSLNSKVLSMLKAEGNEGKSIADIIKSGNWGKNSSWSDLTNADPKNYPDIFKADLLLDAYNKKRNKANKENFDTGALRNALDENIKLVQDSLKNDRYNAMYGAEPNEELDPALYRPDAEDILNSLKDLRSIWYTPSDIDELVSAIPDDVKKERLAMLDKYPQEEIDKLKNEVDSLRNEIKLAQNSNAKEDVFTLRKMLQDKLSKLSWISKASPMVEKLAEESGKTYGQVLTELMDMPKNDNGEYTDKWMQDFMTNVYPKWDIQSKMSELLGGASHGSQQAKRDKTVEVLRRLHDTYPDVLALKSLFGQADDIDNYGTGIPPAKLMDMFFSNDENVRNSASQLLSKNFTRDELIPVVNAWRNLRLANKSAKESRDYNNVRTWAKGSPIQIKGQGPDTTDPMYDLAKAKQDAQYIHDTESVDTLKNMIDDVYDKGGGHSDRYNTAASDLVEAAELMNNLLKGVNLDNPGANK